MLLHQQKVTTLTANMGEPDFLIGGTGVCVLRRTQYDVAAKHAELAKTVARLLLSYKKVFCIVENDKMTYKYVGTGRNWQKKKNNK